MNPRVDDIPDRFSVSHQGIRFLRLGTIETGGSGCICPESALLKALVTHLLLYREEMLILDMEAGVEHLGRATAQAVNAFLVVLEPGRRSLTTSERVRELADDIGITHVYAVGNKVRGERDRSFLRERSPVQVLGYLSSNAQLTNADMRGEGIYDAAPKSVQEAKELVAALEAL
jgi:CO dehydrogenase maturation factor